MAGERAEARPGRRTGTCALACWPLLGLFALAQTWSLACRAAAAQNLRAAQARREARHALLEAGVVQRPGGFEDPVPLRHVDSRAAAAVWVAGLSFLLPAMLLLCVQCLERTRTAIGASVLAHFALRGACLAAPAALLAQGLAQSTAKRIAAAPAAPAAPSPAAWLVTALLAAVTEELAKLLALLLCTDVFLAGAVAGGAPDEEADGPSTACRTEVASPQALTLAGVAVGLGFMAVENAEYAAGEAALGGEIGRPTSIWAMGLLRILCNLHWILAGISASRVALYIAAPSRGAGACLAWPGAVAAAVWPAVCFHAIWDFTIQAVARQGGPLARGLSAPLAICIMCALGGYYASLLMLLWQTWPATCTGVEQDMSERQGGGWLLGPDSESDVEAPLCGHPSE